VKAMSHEELERYNRSAEVQNRLVCEAVDRVSWQPIGTAPKDGTWFLGIWNFRGQAVYRLGHWNQYHKAFNQVPGYHGAPFEFWIPLPQPPFNVNGV
jgi:hypothetical protein